VAVDDSKSSTIGDSKAPVSILSRFQALWASLLSFLAGIKGVCIKKRKDDSTDSNGAVEVGVDGKTRETEKAPVDSKSLNLRVISDGDGDNEGVRYEKEARVNWFKSLPRSHRLYLRGKGAVNNAGGELGAPFPLDSVSLEEISALVGDGAEEFTQSLVDLGYAFFPQASPNAPTRKQKKMSGNDKVRKEETDDE